MTLSETVVRRVLWLAAAWNIVGGASALLAPSQHLATSYAVPFDLDSPVAAFLFRCVWINVIAWGLAYLLAATRPAARTPVMVAGGLGKVLYGVASVALFVGHAGSMALLVAGIFDLLLGVAFLLLVGLPTRRVLR